MFMSVDDVLRIVQAFFRELLVVINAFKVALGMKEADAPTAEESSSGN